MSVSADISTALHLLEHIHDRVKDSNDPKLQFYTCEDLQSLIFFLEDPVLRNIALIQDSLTDLNTQLARHPSILPGDFDISLSGQLELSVPSTPIQPLEISMYRDLYQDNSELDDQRVPVAPLVYTSSEDTTSAQVTSPSVVSEALGIPPISTPTYVKEFQRVIDAAAKGRHICTVQLHKPEGSSLGFSVVGLRSTEEGDLGIFLQEIQFNGIAGCDGRLLEGDQILAIDGQPLDSNISHEQAISILQKARGTVELVVARNIQDPNRILQLNEIPESTKSAAIEEPIIHNDIIENNDLLDKDWPILPSAVPLTTVNDTLSTPSQLTTAVTPSPDEIFIVERSPSAVSDTSKSSSDMVLNTEYAQVEVINLINDGSGLGFGIIGGKSTGVVVKTILPGGVADRDNRLQSGDHILQIGDVNLRGMGSEQVAAVLRQSGTHVRLIVARPVEPTSPDYQTTSSYAPIVPTKILGDPDELDRHLVDNDSETNNIRHSYNESFPNSGCIFIQDSDMNMLTRKSLIVDVTRTPTSIGSTRPILLDTIQSSGAIADSTDLIDVSSLPEVERFTIQLKKDNYGLGITIAGYVCEKEELSGIFVKSISKGSAADMNNKIQINDRIVEVDGQSLQGFTNHEAVEVLRTTGSTVHLCLERYLRGPKYEQLQQAIAASEFKLPQPSSPSITSLPTYPISTDGEATTEIEIEGNSLTTTDNSISFEINHGIFPSEIKNTSPTDIFTKSDLSDLTPEMESTIIEKWKQIVDADTDILVAHLRKFADGGGLGISLEGTVDVENGQEVRPHHYIRSILPEGPVGQDGKLRSGDELLEVNGHRLLGINHMEVVTILKELPVNVVMVCGRQSRSHDSYRIDSIQHQAAFGKRNIHGGSLRNLIPTMDHLVKAKSDGSLVSVASDTSKINFSKVKSRSLEPLTGLAMWSSDPQIIELTKGERGLGFSILDYQDPMNQNETVIVIRSLVPGGVAQADGQLIPGDRLLFVNNVMLNNATLDQAVQALKSAPKGKVLIGIAKPLPISDSIKQLGRNKMESKISSMWLTRMSYKVRKKRYFREKTDITSECLPSVELIASLKGHDNLVRKSDSF